MYGIEHKLLAIIFSLMMLLQAKVVRIYAGTYMVPAAIFSIAWFLYTIIPLIFLFSVPINAYSIIYIYFCTLAFSLSAVPFNWKSSFKTNAINALEKRSCNIHLGSNFIRFCFYISIIFSVILSIALLFNFGFSIKDIIFNLLWVSGRYAAIRGNGGGLYEYGLLGVLNVCFTYLAPILGVFIIQVEKGTIKKSIFFILSILPAIVSMVTQSSKLIFFIAMLIFIASTLLLRIINNKPLVLSVKFLSKILAIILFLIPFVLFSFFSREHYLDLNNLDSSVEKVMFAITSYTLGQIYAFSDFFSSYLGMNATSTYLNDYNSFGSYTFHSIFRMLGDTKVLPPGLYLESGYYKDIYQTNIFTMFRGLIYDFGGIGSVLFMFYFGILIHFFFNRMLIKKYFFLGYVVFITSIVFILNSYLISSFMARYMFLNGFITYFILVINYKIYNRVSVTKSYASKVL